MPNTTSPIFANGTHHELWAEKNCWVCPLAYDEQTGKWLCELEKAIDEASWGDGTMPQEIYDQIGDPSNLKPCKKRLAYQAEQAEKTLPPDQWMRKQGAALLPGIEG